MKTEFTKNERQGLNLLFWPFGVGAMATATRFPEIRDNLHLNNGTFGTYLSLGAVGAWLAFLTIGHVIHRYGIRPVIIAGSTLMYAALAVVPHLHTGIYFLFTNIVISFSLITFHISGNGQAIHRQDQIGKLILPKLHGLWSLGALITSIAAIFVTQFLPLAWHIDLIMVAMWLMTLYGIHKSKPYLIGPTEATDDSPTLSIKSLILSFKTFWLISVAQILALQMEWAVNDWSAIYTRDTIKMNASLSILSYTVFISAMIILRFSIHRLVTRWSEQTLMRFVPRVGGLGFIVFILLGTFTSSHNRFLGFALSLLAFAFAGAGGSFMAPTYFGIAFRNTNLPSSLVVAQIGLINNVMAFFVKVAISWVAQSTSVTVGLLIPGVMLIGTSAFAYLGSSEREVKK